MGLKEKVQDVPKRVWILMPILLALSFTLRVFLPPFYATHLDGTRQLIEGSEALRVNITVHLAGVPMIAAVIALGIALVPYRNLSYGRKYFRSWIFVLSAMYALWILMSAANLLEAYRGS